MSHENGSSAFIFQVTGILKPVTVSTDKGLQLSYSPMVGCNSLYGSNFDFRMTYFDHYDPPLSMVHGDMVTIYWGRFLKEYLVAECFFIGGSCPTLPQHNITKKHYKNIGFHCDLDVKYKLFNCLPILATVLWWAFNFFQKMLQIKKLHTEVGRLSCF